MELTAVDSAMPKIIDHDERRIFIARCAADLVAEEGVDKLTMRRVAEYAACTTGMVTHYYKTKQEILTAALHFVTDNVEADESVWESCATMDDFLELLYHTMPQNDSVTRFIKVWMAFWSMASSDPELSKVHKKYYAENRKGLAKVIAKLQRLGVFKADLEPVRAANCLQSCIDGVAVGAILDPTYWTRKRQRTVVTDFLAAWRVE